MIGPLLTTRRFAPLFITQFLGAFNDNLLKSARSLVRVASIPLLGTGKVDYVEVARLAQQSGAVTEEAQAGSIA
jgi:hypothetical protein